MWEKAEQVDMEHAEHNQVIFFSVNWFCWTDPAYVKFVMSNKQNANMKSEQNLPWNNETQAKI